MSYVVANIGDAGGDGHTLTLEHTGEGIVILQSENPDSGQNQRVVMLEDQWQSISRILLETYGADKCLWRDNCGNCTLPCQDDG